MGYIALMMAFMGWIAWIAGYRILAVVLYASGVIGAMSYVFYSLR